jgi:hypothetical protein
VDCIFHNTNPATNEITGEPNARADIAAGASQSFVFGFTVREPFDATDVLLRFECENTEAAGTASGINTLLRASSVDPVPDIIALSATVSGDGVLRIADIAAPGAFSVATVNLGSAATITATVQHPGLAVTVSLCETDPMTAACLNPAVPADTVTTTVDSNDTPTFSIFVTAHDATPLNAAASRLTVRFADAGGSVRGATGVAIEALAPPAAPTLSTIQASIFTPLCSSCHGGARRPTS